jgi:hypothetical protein
VRECRDVARWWRRDAVEWRALASVGYGPCRRIRQKAVHAPVFGHERVTVAAGDRAPLEWAAVTQAWPLVSGGGRFYLTGFSYRPTAS